MLLLYLFLWQRIDRDSAPVADRDGVLSLKRNASQMLSASVLQGPIVTSG